MPKPLLARNSIAFKYGEEVGVNAALFDNYSKKITLLAGISETEVNLS